MNRKDRRAAAKGGRGAAPFPPSPQGLAPNLAANAFAAAVRYFQAGQFQQAEHACRDVLVEAPNHADALHLLGMIAFKLGHPQAALDLLGRSLAVNHLNPDCHFNMAQAFGTLGQIDQAAHHLAQTCALAPQNAVAHAGLADVLMQQGRLDEARARFERAISLQPQLIPAQFGLGFLDLQQGRFEQSAAQFGRVLALKPDYAEAAANLGVALVALGRSTEAIAQYRRALELKPELVDIYRNLGRLLLERGEPVAALEQVWLALGMRESDEAKLFFCQCMHALPALPPEGPLRDNLAHLLERALTEGWTRPVELSLPASNFIRAREAVWTCVKQVADGWPAPLTAIELRALEGISSVATDPLLRAFLELAPVIDPGLERFLTRIRGAVLELALASDASATIDDDLLGFLCALARQCFINEYLFAESENEKRKLRQLQEQLDAALTSGAPVCALWPVALAAYAPLHSLTNEDAMLQRSWPVVLAPLMEQQVREPLAERRLRAGIPALTAIEDEISQKVRQQYEEMPYPRWLKVAPVGRPIPVDWYLRNQFPLAPFQNLGPKEPLDLLIAGCGTGQHAIESALRFAGARTLAVDLSLASLGYAKRKTQELGITNIEYAQADILKLDAIGRTFDLIEAAGVLHHLRDPEEGWRVLLSLLRPGGLMHIGLYSAPARADIRAARDLIAERGYGRSADDIRRVRQELIAADSGTQINTVRNWSDFYTTSACCDLLFHVQEHQFTIPRIRDFLREHHLVFLGFAGAPAQHYRQRNPGDSAGLDLERWHEFETAHPTTFVSMYQFWVQKPAA